jgi:phosphatidylglycerol---prolipoprotein diacylglyceryl transferase
MYPILLHWPRVTTYGVMMLLGLIAGWFIARRQARRLGLDPSHMDLLSPLIVLAGLGGAVLFGALADSVHAAEGDSAHGRVLYGALLVAVAAGIAYALIAKITLGDLGDTFAAPIALGIAFGRVGCFLAGCCWGKVCSPAVPFAVRFPRGSFPFLKQVAAGVISPFDSTSLPVHPTQLYEAVAVTVIAVALLILFRRPRVSGELFLRMAIAYAAFRFAIEFFRADNLPIFRRFTLSQVICLATALTAFVTLLIRQWAAKRWGLLRPRSVDSSNQESARAHG